MYPEQVKHPRFHNTNGFKAIKRPNTTEAVFVISSVITAIIQSAGKHLMEAIHLDSCNGCILWRRSEPDNFTTAQFIKIARMSRPPKAGS